MSTYLFRSSRGTAPDRNPAQIDRHGVVADVVLEAAGAAHAKLRYTAGVRQAADLRREHRRGRKERISRMITLTTYKWVPDFAAPLMRAFRVRWALEEAGLPYNVRTLALGPEQKSPEHLARQPFGQAPAIAEDGLILFESGAIALYVAEKREKVLP